MGDNWQAVQQRLQQQQQLQHQPLGAASLHGGTDSHSAADYHRSSTGQSDRESGVQYGGIGFFGGKAQPVWFSVTMEAEELHAPGAGSHGAMPDWTLTVRAPLRLHNALPVPSTYTLWEKPAAGGPLKMRQRGRCTACGSSPVHAADVRQQLWLTYSPDGCEFGETEPVLLCQGYTAHSAGVAGEAGSA